MHIMEGVLSGQWFDSTRAGRISNTNGMPIELYPSVVLRGNPHGNRTNGYRFATPATTRGGMGGVIPGYRRDQKNKGSTPGIR